MSKLSTTVWVCYILLVVLMCAGKYEILLVPGEPQNTYYHILMAFHPINSIYYYAAVIQLLINCIHILPLFLFIFNRRFGPHILWQTLFFTRILFDIIGQNYEINEITGLFQENIKIVLLFCLASVVLWAPSYIACYLYAFRTKK